jgi:hypothetical protein
MTTDTSIEEEIAIALFQANTGSKHSDWLLIVDYGREQYRAMAKAAIKACDAAWRERLQSEEMVEKCRQAGAAYQAAYNAKQHQPEPVSLRLCAYAIADQEAFALMGIESLRKAAAAVLTAANVKWVE